MVSVQTLVSAMLRAAHRVEALSGACYYVKDLDCNFFQFYQEIMLGRRVWPLIHIPSWVLIVVSFFADLCMRAFAVLGLSRHPFLSLNSTSVALLLYEFTHDDSDTRQDLGYMIPQKCWADDGHGRAVKAMESAC